MTRPTIPPDPWRAYESGLDPEPEPEEPPPRPMGGCARFVFGLPFVALLWFIGAAIRAST